MCVCVWRVVHVVLLLLGAHLGNDTGRRTVTMVILLLLTTSTSGLVRYEAKHHSCGTSCGVIPPCDSVH